MAFEELKQRQAQVWGSAPFENVAEHIAALHDRLVRELDPQPGERWLDVGTGTGAVAVRAARAGAQVTASDLAPTLVETAKRLAAEEGLEIDFGVADAERLPYDDASFDVVSSAVGAMFAPDHARVASELARVTRPGGRLGLVTWEPDGGIGHFFRMLAPFQPPPPDGAGNPLDWGREDYVRGLLGDAFELRFVHDADVWPSFEPEEHWDVMRASFGPIKTLTDVLDERGREELHGAFIEYFESYRRDGHEQPPRQFLVVLGTRR